MVSGYGNASSITISPLPSSLLALPHCCPCALDTWWFVQAREERDIVFISDEMYHGICCGKKAQTARAYSGQCCGVNSFSKDYSMTGEYS